MNIFEQLNSRSKDNRFDGVVNTESPQQTSSQENFSSDNIFHQINNEQKNEIKYSFLETARDIGEQALTKGAAGIGGAYGNILQALGLQLGEGETLPGQQARSSQQFNVLEKMERGEVPSYGEFLQLSDDEVAPNIVRLPTSKEIQSGIEQFTGIGQGKTPAGRIAGRAAEFAGESVPTGGGAKALLGLGLSGAAGQGLRESGAPEALATGTEIAGAIVPSLIQGKVFPRKQEAQELAKAGRKLGLSESQLTPLVQGEGKAALLSKVARKGTRTKELFGSIKEKLGDSYNVIKSSPEAKVKLVNADQIALRKGFGQIRNEMMKTLAPSPDKEAALNYIEKALDTLRNVDVTPEYLVNFWQDINKSVKWNAIQGGKKSLAALKEPIAASLKRASPQLAEDFDMTNKLYTKYSQISKKLKPDVVDSFLSKGEAIAIPATVGYALVTGNPMALAGFASESALRLLGREMLINPHLQNIGTKLVKNFNQSSAKGVKDLLQETKSFLEKKHPDEDWSFLTED